MAATPRTTGRLPDFLIVGAPKAGTSALHAALAQHPQLAMSTVKEPKYFLCGDAPPPLFTGPGDAHSRREWIWRRDDYLDLFEEPGAEVLSGESTPLYLADADARRRIAATVPRARLICVLRDPVDRAYSNWTHLWVDGLEPIPDVVDACLAEPRRVDDGWAPFWRYLGLGRYGEQLAALFELFPREQVLIIRYRDLVDTPSEALDRVFRFLGVRPGVISAIPGDNTRPFVMDGWQTRALSSAVRAGSRLGSAFEPKAWRRVSRPLINALHRRGRAERPALPVDQRQTLLGHFEADLELLEHVTGTSFTDWRSEDSEGAFASRVADQDRPQAS
jgi:hypothetical protein